MGTNACVLSVYVVLAIRPVNLKPLVMLPGVRVRLGHDVPLRLLTMYV